MEEPFTGIPTTAPTSATPRRPTLTLDVALYEGYLAESGMDAAQKRAVLEDLWSIIVGFVDLGFAVEPAAKLPDDAGDGQEEFAHPDFALLGSSANSTTDHFEKAATAKTSPDR